MGSSTGALSASFPGMLSQALTAKAMAVRVGLQAVPVGMTPQVPSAELDAVFITGLYFSKPSQIDNEASVHSVFQLPISKSVAVNLTVPWAVFGNWNPTLKDNKRDEFSFPTDVVFDS
ncbi:hypothetical protein P5673_002694 [Acropora cervicornis]|uniref:Uncharacterized protein n=1 Tax=Acropora cervicornis TaxID=6130 RepID=A0AAD9VFX6_ACRCE|nr:hypothetical protein P5673_002694 [Acropora cervicornis]